MCDHLHMSSYFGEHLLNIPNITLTFPKVTKLWDITKAQVCESKDLLLKMKKVHQNVH